MLHSPVTKALCSGEKYCNRVKIQGRKNDLIKEKEDCKKHRHLVRKLTEKSEVALYTERDQQEELPCRR